MSKQEDIVKDFLLPDLTKDGSDVYLQKIRHVAETHRGSTLHLKQMEKYSFTVGPIAETSHRDEPEMLEEWEEFYLPDHMFMAVFGVIKEFPCDSIYNELVLMVCEDGKVFGYEGNTLHLTNNNLKELFERGLQFPGTEEFYRGQSFEDMTREDWEKVNDSGPSEMMKETLKCMKDSYLDNLDIIMGRKQVESSPGVKPIPVHPVK